MTPPAIRICPLFRTVALWRYRPVFRLACVVPEVTISVEVPFIDPEVAVIVAVQTAAAVARPALLTPTIFAFDDAHVLDEVRFCVLPSV